MKFETIIFDIDGTMADTLDMCVEAFQITLKEIQGRDYSPAEITRYFGMTEEGMYKFLVSPAEYERTLSTYYGVFDELQAQHKQTFPGILPLLERVKASGAKMGVVTGKGITTAKIALKHFGVLSFFDHVEGGNDEKKSKEYAMRKMLDVLSANPDRALYLGDAPQDMIDAQACGMYGAGAAWASTAVLKQADWNGRVTVFNSVAAFEDWLFV